MRKLLETFMSVIIALLTLIGMITVIVFIRVQFQPCGYFELTHPVLGITWEKKKQPQCVDSA